MKRLALVVLMALWAGAVFAEPSQNSDIISVQASDNNYNFLVGTGATVYTKSFPMIYGDRFAILYNIGNPINNYPTANVSIFLQQSDRLPVTEGSPDIFWATFPQLNIIATGTINKNVGQIASFATIALPYGRLIIRENSNRASDTYMTISIGAMGQTVK